MNISTIDVHTSTVSCYTREKTAVSWYTLHTKHNVYSVRQMTIYESAIA